MSVTDWIALASVVVSGSVAIAGVAAAVAVPLVTEWIRRRNARDERLMTERLAAYPDLLYEVRSISWHWQQRLVGRPGSTNFDGERVDRVINRVQTIGGKKSERRSSSSPPQPSPRGSPWSSLMKHRAT